MALSVRATRAVSAKPAARRMATGVRPVQRVAPRVVVRSTPEQEQAALAAALKDAENCGEQGECAAAWDAVEEISAAISHHKQADATTDPLEKYCNDNPDADECRVYDD